MFFEIPIDLAITLIGTPSARCNRRISAQSSTANTPHLLPRGRGQVLGRGQFSVAVWGSVFTCRRHIGVLVVSAQGDPRDVVLVEHLDDRLDPEQVSVGRDVVDDDPVGGRAPPAGRKTLTRSSRSRSLVAASRSPYAAALALAQPIRRRRQRPLEPRRQGGRRRDESSSSTSTG